MLLVDTKHGINTKLEVWRNTLECNFRKSKNKYEGTVRLDGQVIPKSVIFRYLASIIHKDKEIGEDVNHKIRVKYVKWRSTIGVLCNRRIPIKLKGKFYRTAIRTFFLFSTECWVFKK